MHARLTWAAVLSIVSIPLLAIGFLDPLEGLPFLVIGLALFFSVRLLSKVRIPRLTWITIVIVAVLMAATLAIAIAGSSPAPTHETVVNPMMRGIMIGEVPLLIVFMWLARLAELPMIAGLIVYTVKIFRARTALKAA